MNFDGLVQLIDDTIENGKHIYYDFSRFDIKSYRENLEVIFEEIISSSKNEQLKNYIRRIARHQDLDSYKLSTFGKIIYDVLFFLHRNQSWNSNSEVDLLKRYVIDMNTILVNLKNQL